jgi:hypothetical protein
MKMETPKMKSNYGKGPSVGNASARAGKRDSFMEGKKERSNLADSINEAFRMRSPTNFSKTKTTIDSTLEGVESDVKPKKFKK